MTIKNFKISEFYCHDVNQTKIPNEYIDNVNELMLNLQVLRDELGVPIHISSGYRTPEYNKRIGGAKRSFHLKAMAADIYTDEYSASEVHKTIQRLIDEGKMKEGGLGKYRTFTHYDVRDYKARWDKT